MFLDLNTSKPRHSIHSQMETLSKRAECVKENWLRISTAIVIYKSLHLQVMDKISTGAVH